VIVASANALRPCASDLGHVLFRHLTLPSHSLPFPAATAAAAAAITFYICLDRPLPGAPLGGLPVYSPHTQHRTCAGVLRFASTPLSGV
jgi:hypothetical protein